MSAANPAAWYFAAVALPIIAFYLIRPRTPQVRVATVMFWDDAVSRSRASALWLRVRHVVSLFIQLLVVSLLVLALIDLRPSAQSGSAQRRVVVLDNSASMRARHGNRSRFELARDAALRAVRTLGTAEEAAIITAGGHPAVVCGFTNSQSALEHAIDTVSVTSDGTSAKDAVRLARQITRSGTARRVMLFTDGCFPPAPELTDSAELEVVSVAEPVSNLAITTFHVRELPDDPQAFDLLVGVTNHSDRAATCRLDLDLAGQPLDAIPLMLEPDQHWQQAIPLTIRRGGILSARLTPGDSFVEDDEARAEIRPGARVPVTLVTDGNLFLQRLLEADKAVALTVTTEVPESAPDKGVLIIHARGPATVPAGNVVFVQPSAPTDLWQISEPVTAPHLMIPDAAADLLQNVQLDQVLIPEIIPVKPRVPYRSLVTTDQGDSVLVEIPRDSGDVIVLAVNLDRSDLPLRTAFPILMSNILNRLRSSESVIHSSVISPDESDLRPRWVPRPDAAPVESAFGGWPAWYVGTVLAGVLLCGEWLCYHRRWTS